MKHVRLAKNKKQFVSFRSQPLPITHDSLFRVMKELLEAFLLLPLLALSKGATWDYTDTTNWATDYPTCGGSRQSPINIDKDEAFGADFSDFTFSLNYKILQKGTIENNGYSRRQI